MHLYVLTLFSFFFFFNDTATTEIYTLSLHDALPILTMAAGANAFDAVSPCSTVSVTLVAAEFDARSEEHTSELQSHSDLVCRLLLEKKKNNANHQPYCAGRAPQLLHRMRGLDTLAVH